MKTNIIIAIAGIAITSRLGAVPCGAVNANKGYNTYTYQSSYISGTSTPRCQDYMYFYFFNNSSDSTDDSNLCPTEYTRTFKVTEYIKDAYSSSIASTNQVLGNNNNPVYGFQTCNVCKSGYNHLLLAIIEDPNTHQEWGIYGCGKCDGESGWTKSGNIESSKTCYTIDGSPVSEYRCADGFYGTAKDGSTSNCSICPPLQNGQTSPEFATSVAGENTYITDCYLEPGTHKDTTGTFKISSDCPYKQ